MMRHAGCIALVLALGLDPSSWAATREPLLVHDCDEEKAFASALVKRYEEGLPATLSTLNEQLRESKRFAFSPAEGRTRKWTPDRLYQRCRPSIVLVGKIYMCGRCDEWHARMATGFVVGKDGLVVTNYHVVEAGKRDKAIGVQTHDGQMLAVEAVLASDKPEDLALLKVDADDLAPLPVAEDVDVGTQVYVISHADRHFYTLTEGIVSHMGLRRPKGGPVRIMSITADFARGSSGAPVLNRHGAVVGIAHSTDPVYYTEDHGVGTDIQMVWKRCTPSISLLEMLREDPES